MNSLTEQSKCLASLALFSELYDQGQDIYTVVAKFIEALIIEKGVFSFNLNTVTDLLNKNYSFSIPAVVVKSSIKRISYVQKKNHEYYVNKQEQPRDTLDLNQQILSTEDLFKSILQELSEYMRQNYNCILEKYTEEEIYNSFCSFVLDETSLKANDIIKVLAAFIITKQQDSVFKKNLNIVKEGVLLNIGINYSNLSNKNPLWNNEFIFFLDTEILFYLAGYNGILFKEMFYDFYNIVKDINVLSNKKYKRDCIKLKYFKFTEAEVNQFFNVAEKIVEKKSYLEPKNDAMKAIVNGCLSPSEVLVKKGIFYNLLDSLKIVKDENDKYFEKEKHIYNIEDSDLIRSLREKNGDDVEKSLKLLNLINILRQGKMIGFNEVKYYLVTRTFITLSIAKDEMIRKRGDVPLATDMNYLIDRFWFSLKKGLGEGEPLKSIDVVVRSQIVLSSLLSKSIQKKYDSSISKLKSGELTIESAEYVLADLRRYTKKPEEIKEEDLDDVLQFIDESSVESIIEEKELIKKQLSENKEKCETLTAEKVRLERENELKDELIQDKEKEIKRIRDAEEQRTKKRKRNLNALKQCGFFLLLILIFFFARYLWIFISEILSIWYVIVSPKIEPIIQFLFIVGIFLALIKWLIKVYKRLIP